MATSWSSRSKPSTFFKGDGRIVGATLAKLRGVKLSELRAYKLSDFRATPFSARSGGSNEKNTGLKSPSATGDDYNYWTNPANAYVSDDVYANDSVVNHFQDYYNFDFGVPTNATINGIEIKIEGYGDDANASNRRLWVYISGTGNSEGASDPRVCAFLTSDSIKTFGDSSDLWGRSWTPNFFSNANFRVYIRNLSNHAKYIDHIQAKVYYTGIYTSWTPRTKP